MTQVIYCEPGECVCWFPVSCFPVFSEHTLGSCRAQSQHPRHPFRHLTSPSRIWKVKTYFNTAIKKRRERFHKNLLIAREVSWASLGDTDQRRKHFGCFVIVCRVNARFSEISRNTITRDTCKLFEKLKLFSYIAIIIISSQLISDLSSMGYNQLLTRCYQFSERSLTNNHAHTELFNTTVPTILAHGLA